MKLIIGLGNPGSKYKKNRHNVGFMFLDFLSETEKFKNEKFQEEKKFFGSGVKTNNVILLKPSTYMNNSGQAAQAVVNFYKIQNSAMLIIHDDLDLEFGQIKLQTEKSSAGHNGVDSIINALGTNRFWRLRIGINNGLKDKIPGDKFVLADFLPQEMEKLPDIFGQSLEIISEFMHNEDGTLTNKNLKIPV